MRLLPLLCSLLLLVACFSNSSSGAPVPEPSGPGYYKDFPADDGVDIATLVPENGYARQLVLEEEVIASARELDSSPEIEGSDDFQAPVERVPVPAFDESYTLQLAAVKETAQALEYAQRYQIDSEQAGVAKILSGGKLWYVLVYGVYTSREEANLAKSGLQARGVPEPWVRTLATLEASAREASENGY